MARKRISVAGMALYAFLGLLGMSMVACVFVWVYLPPHDIHPDNHPLDNLLSRTEARVEHFPPTKIDTRPKTEQDPITKAASIVKEVDSLVVHTKVEELQIEKVETKVHELPASVLDGDSDGATPKYHMVFSTSCSPFQDWQSYFFFYFAWKVGQPGTVTRIASGCKPNQIRDLEVFHKEKISVMSDRFHVHFAPQCPDSRSKYFNKPYGIRDFLESVLGYPDPTHDDDIIMIVDPDMMLLRPLTHKFEVDKISWVSTGKDPLVDSVRHGHPIAQTYGFSDSWLNSLGQNKSYIAGPDSPAIKVSAIEARKRFPAGPPYLATARDMYNIALHWTKFVVRIHDVFPKMMSEMHAYSFAAAHLGLKHQLANGFMVSDVTCPGIEGWNFLRNVTKEEACVPDAVPMDRLPFVFHYCQRYALGRWFIGKYKIPKNFFECDAPLLREPPVDAPVKYDWFIYPNNKDTANYSNKPFRVLQNGWAMCRLIASLNEAATDFKQKYCPKMNANFEKKTIFHDAKVFEAFVQGEPEEIGYGNSNF